MGLEPDSDPETKMARLSARHRVVWMTLRCYQRQLFGTTRTAKTKSGAKR